MEDADLMLTPDLSLAEASDLARRLEREPNLMPAYWLTVEQIIAACMELAFKATEPAIKMSQGESPRAKDPDRKQYRS